MTYRPTGLIAMYRTAVSVAAVSMLAMALLTMVSACSNPATDQSADPAIDRSISPTTTDGPLMVRTPTGSATPGPATTGPASTQPASTVSDPPRSRSLQIIAGGDILNEGRVNAAAAIDGIDRADGQRFDFTDMFAPVAPIIAAADLAICHAELPIGRSDQGAGVYGRSPHGGNRLLAPYELAPALAAAGFDHCSTASNHSADLGAEGIASTIDALAEVGITVAGTALSPAESLPFILEVNGVRVAHLAYTRTDNNDGLAERWMLNRYPDLDEIVDDVNTARRLGAEIVIVSIHLGTEMSPQPTTGDREFAESLLAASPIDLLVHHGPHVVQPYEVLDGTPVYWSLGNFVSGMGVPGTGRYEDPRALDGLLAQVTFTETAPGSFEVDADAVLICNERAARTVRAPVSELADPWVVETIPDWLVAELRACIARTASVVDRFK